MPKEDTQFQSSNIAPLKHGAFSDKIPLSERGQELVRNGITLLVSLPNFRQEFIPLVQRLERIWIILLKLDEWEDQNPNQTEFKHWSYKATYESSFRHNLALLFTLLGQKKIDISRDFAKELSEAGND